MSHSLKELSEKRLTVEDLQLRPGEEQTLKSASKDFRMAMWKADEHHCLTTYPDCCRMTAVKMREYHRMLTLSPANKIPELDATKEDIEKGRMQQYFLNNKKRHAHS